MPTTTTQQLQLESASSAKLFKVKSKKTRSYSDSPQGGRLTFWDGRAVLEAGRLGGWL